MPLKLVILVLVSAAIPTFAACQKKWGAESNFFEAGVLMEVLMPNRLPDFDSSLTVFGPVVGIPLGDDTLSLSSLYGSSAGQSAFTGELAYRFNLPTPYVRLFLFLGGHFFYHSYLPNQSHYSRLGIDGGVGFRMDLNKSAQAMVQAKLYKQDRSFFSLGAGFAFLL